MDTRSAAQRRADTWQRCREITHAGTSVLRFDDDGLVVDEWDAWNQTDGRLDPNPGWAKA